MCADIVRLSLATCVGGLAFVVAVMADEASPEGEQSDPAIVVVPAAAGERFTYPQVNMAAFSREYRPIPISAPAADAAIREALRAPMRRLHDFEETPLRAVIDQFSDSSGLPIACDTLALTDAGIDLDATTVTQALTRTPGVSLAAALRCVLRDVGLTWIMRDDVLTVTTREKAQENLVVVAYPLPRGFGAGRPVLKVHRVADAAARQSLAQTLVGLCNKALPDAADPKAEVTVVGDSVAVVSTSPEFHALAAQVVAAVDGVVDRSPMAP